MNIDIYDCNNRYGVIYTDPPWLSGGSENGKNDI